MRRVLGVAISQSLITSLCLIFTLQLWRTDLRVPINYWGDTLLQLTVIKSISDGGWIWFIDRLGAPFGLAIVAFPQNLTTTSLIIKALSAFSKEPGLLLNGYWLLTVILASVNANVSLRILGFRERTCFLLATLYGLLPYALYRNTAHLPLVYPYVPVLAAFAIQVAANQSRALNGKWGKYVIACAIAQGFDYIYYTFFSVFFFLVASLSAVFYYRSWMQARRALLLCGVLVVAAVINLAPSFIEWSRNGKPPNTIYKAPAEAEVYGLKLRQLLSPVQPSRLRVIREFGDKEQQFPNENENQSTRLGTIISAGFVGLLAYFLFRRRVAALITASATLLVAGVLLGTVGGFGAIFNLVVTPDIRAYNRIVVFLAFFTAVFLAYVVDQATASQHVTPSENRRSGHMAWLGLAGCFVLGVLDQGQAARPLIERYISDAESFNAERMLVAQIEQQFPMGGAIMELPETSFPPDGGRANMLAYDHARPLLWSTKFSWSWPSFSQRREAWYNSLGSPLEPIFVDRLVISGFNGIWLDRYGYRPDDLSALEGVLVARLGKPLIGGVRQRYAFFDLSPLQQQSRNDSGTQHAERANEKYRLLNPLLLTFNEGFYGEEQNGEKTHRWSKNVSSLRIRNSGQTTRTAVFHALIQAGQGGILRTKVGSRTNDEISFLPTESKSIAITVTVPAQTTGEIAFVFDGPQFMVPGDSRILYFAVINPRIDEQ